jgi:hypothetical protein
VPLEGEQRIVPVHPVAIVRDAQEPAPARLNVKLYAARARVDGIFHQLFRHRRRALDNFARRDLICEMI